MLIKPQQIKMRNGFTVEIRSASVLVKTSIQCFSGRVLFPNHLGRAITEQGNT